MAADGMTKVSTQALKALMDFLHSNRLGDHGVDMVKIEKNVAGKIQKALAAKKIHPHNISTGWLDDLANAANLELTGKSKKENSFFWQNTYYRVKTDDQIAFCVTEISYAGGSTKKKGKAKNKPKNAKQPRKRKETTPNPNTVDVITKVPKRTPMHCCNCGKGPGGTVSCSVRGCWHRMCSRLTQINGEWYSITNECSVGTCGICNQDYPCMHFGERCIHHNHERERGEQEVLDDDAPFYWEMMVPRDPTPEVRGYYPYNRGGRPHQHPGQYQPRQYEYAEWKRAKERTEYVLPPPARTKQQFRCCVADCPEYTTHDQKCKAPPCALLCYSEGPHYPCDRHVVKTRGDANDPVRGESVPWVPRTCLHCLDVLDSYGPQPFLDPNIRPMYPWNPSRPRWRTQRFPGPSPPDRTHPWRGYEEDFW